MNHIPSFSPRSLAFFLLLLVLSGVWGLPACTAPTSSDEEISPLEFPKLQEPSSDSVDAGDGVPDSTDGGTTCLPTSLRGQLGQEVEGILSMYLHSDSRELLVGGKDGLLRRWNVETGKALGLYPAHTGGLSALALSPNGKWLVTGGKDKQLQVWDWSSKTRQQTLSGHSAEILAVVWAPDNQQFVSSAADGTIRLWERGKTSSLKTWKVALGNFPRVKLSPDQRWLAAINDKGIIFVWDRKQPDATPAILREHAGQPTTLAFSPDSRWLLSGGDEGSLLLWDTQGWKKKSDLQEHKAAITGLQFSKDGKQFYSVDKSKAEIVVWELESEKILYRLERNPVVGEFQQVVFSSDAKWLASLADGILRTRTLPTGKQLLSKVSFQQQIDTALFYPDGAGFATAGTSGDVLLWSSSTGARNATLKGHKSGVQVLGWNQSEDLLVSGAQTLRWWDPYKASFRISWNSGSVLSLAFSPNDRSLFTGDLGHVREWFVSSGEIRNSFKVGTGLIRHLAHHPTKPLLAVAVGKTIQLWDTEKREKRREWTTHQSEVSSLAFSRDGSRLASTSANEGIWLWDTTDTSKEEPLSKFLWNNKKGYSHLFFHPNGTHLLAATGTGELIFWAWTTQKVTSLPATHPNLRALHLSHNGRWLISATTGKKGHTLLTWWNCNLP